MSDQRNPMETPLGKGRSQLSLGGKDIQSETPTHGEAGEPCTAIVAREFPPPGSAPSFSPMSFPECSEYFSREKSFRQQLREAEILEGSLLEDLGKVEKHFEKARLALDAEYTKREFLKEGLVRQDATVLRIGKRRTKWMNEETKITNKRLNVQKKIRDLTHIIADGGE